ncbi:MFS general substrate transporter [Pisolithus orientalis]|uniref:MFS general substrate transporter n=1 Tax=Pisolithus orientalis TaxID=936130 RepID=UPI0022258D7E|nr:MFS general substrate transporter [Pisolithus orientalis]KAI5986309.1 MFS general substrate transporter [Pisolithus orientalis]
MSSPMKQRPNGSPYLRRVKLALACVSIAANTLCAGGIICFPLIAPTLVTQLKLTQPQLTTFYAYSGMAGQYLFAAFAGKAIDYYGPWICSLASAVLFSTGFGLFAREIALTPVDIVTSSDSSYRRLAFYFLICAAGTVCSFLSAVVTASKNFPHYIGLATGTSAALFGLSPTFLSILATRYFSRPDTGLDVTQFLRFLALLSGFVHLVGAFTMHVQPPVEECLSKPFDTDTEDPAELADECTSLLPKTSSAASFDVTPATDEDLRSQSALDMLKDFNFWILAFIVFVILGSCEMVISNIGTIVLSLPSRYFPTTALDGIPSGDLATSTQTSFLLSHRIRNPSSRGTLRKHFVSRLVFLAFSSSVLVCTCLWTVVGIRSQAALWALSIGAGIAYGCAFTILPSLVSSIWGIHNLGRNYGILIYAPFLGTSVFSYLYAFVAVEHTPADGGVCMGVRCWRATFEVSGVAAALAFVATLWLWKAWRGKV